MSRAHPSLETVVRLVRERTGLNFSSALRERAEQGIRHALQRSGLEPDAYRNKLETSPAALDELVSELTIGETYFFREPGQFEFLRRQVLPELRQRGPEQPIRAWSAGCASGEEAYSLAFLLEEEDLIERAQLLATDINQAALARARQATYTAWSLRGDWADRARRYLVPRGKRFVVAEKVRHLVRFEYLNLVLDPGLFLAVGACNMDLILCRNVLIYLTAEAAARVAPRLFAALAPGGWLLTASSDPPLQDCAPFEVVVNDAGVFYRRPLSPLSPLGRGVGGEGSCWSAARENGLRCALHTHPGNEKPLTPNPSPQRGEGRKSANPDTTPLQRIRALAARDLAEAERVCAAESERSPLAVELHYLHAALLLEQGREDAAIQALRRVLYLDRSLALAHFTLGALLDRRGDRAGAWRCYRNARDLCQARPEEEIVPLSDGEPAGRLVQAAEFQLARLAADAETTP